MQPGQAPNQAQPHSAASGASMAAPLTTAATAQPRLHYAQPFRPAGAHGLTASPFFTPDNRASLQTLYDTLAALRVIAQMPELVDETREFLIDCIEETVTGQIPGEEHESHAYTLAALRLYGVIFDGELDLQWPQRLIQATRRDISRPRCANWPDLLLYCRYAAEPLGRAVLQLHDVSSPEVERATDALTASLLILNQLRRMGTDWRQHGRCYLPTDWFAEEGGTPEQLVEPKASPATRRVIDRVLDRISLLLSQAAPLPTLLNDPRLRAEAVRLLTHARYQHRQLRRQDPLAKRLSTPAPVQLLAYLNGWWAGKRG